MTHISAILNVHCEGDLARGSLLSIAEARRIAEAAGIAVEVLAVADCSDRATLDVLAGSAGVRVLECGFRDLGQARNAGVAAAAGRYVAFLDGDDLWGPNWLRKAYEAAIAEPRAVVWHPEANLYFGAEHELRWMIHPDSETIEGDWVALGVRNQWTSLSFALRDTYSKIPYPSNDLAAGFGKEDWSWNSEVVAHGYLHKPVPDTAHLIRVREGSLLRRTDMVNALMTPSTLLRSRIGWAARVGSVGVAAPNANGYAPRVA